MFVGISSEQVSDYLEDLGWLSLISRKTNVSIVGGYGTSTRNFSL